MKKSYLLLLAILPIFGSCNKNSGFANPFPNDDKINSIVGFKLDDNEEKILYPLTSDDKNVVIYTIQNKSTYDDKIMSSGKNQKCTRYVRDYTRAFAGEFKQGYDISNYLKNETFFVTRQDGDGTGSQPSTRKRRKVNNISKTIHQYAYGQIEENVTQDDYYYYSSGDFKEANTRDLSSSVSKRTKKTKTDASDTVLLSKESGAYVDDKDLEYFLIPQSGYISEPNDIKSGKDKNGNIILVNATQKKHKSEEEGAEEGVFALKDGRRYQAMDNSITVTRLKIQNDAGVKWCLAEYVRVYSEIVITSEVIQPNVPITKLSSPIRIHLSEEKQYFSTEAIDDAGIKDVLPGENQP